MILDIIRAPYRQVAKDILTPGKFYSDAIAVAGANMSDFLRLNQAYFTPQFQRGIDYVPQTGPAIVHEGERIISREENIRGGQPIQITIELDGRILSEYIYKETKRGNKLVHSRGITG